MQRPCSSVVTSPSCGSESSSWSSLWVVGSSSPSRCLCPGSSPTTSWRLRKRPWWSKMSFLLLGTFFMISLVLSNFFSSVTKITHCAFAPFPTKFSALNLTSGCVRLLVASLVKSIQQLHWLQLLILCFQKGPWVKGVNNKVNLNFFI